MILFIYMFQLFVIHILLSIIDYFEQITDLVDY